MCIALNKSLTKQYLTRNKLKVYIKYCKKNRLNVFKFKDFNIADIFFLTSGIAGKKVKCNIVYFFSYKSYSKYLNILLRYSYFGNVLINTNPEKLKKQ